MGGYEQEAKNTSQLLCLAVENCLLAMGGPFLSSFAQTGLGNALSTMSGTVGSFQSGQVFAG